MGFSLPTEAYAPRRLEDSVLILSCSESPCPSNATDLPKSDSSGKCQSASDLLPTGPAGPVGAERSPRSTDRQGQGQVSPVRVSGQGPGHWHWPWLAPDYVSCRAFHLSLSPPGWGQNSFPFKRANDLLFPCLLLFFFLIRNYPLKVQSPEGGSHLITSPGHGFPVLPSWVFPGPFLVPRCPLDSADVGHPPNTLSEEEGGIEGSVAGVPSRSGTSQFYTNSSSWVPVMTKQAPGKAFPPGSGATLAC